MTITSLFNPADKSMQTDPTEETSFTAYLTCDGGFTQAWDTVGAGIISLDGESLT